MMAPSWVFLLLAAPMLVVAAVSATRLVAAGSDRLAGTADADLAHLLMCVAMGGMLAAGIRTLPPRAWEVVFVVVTMWFGWRWMRDTRANGVRSLVSGRYAAHLSHSAAMLYMVAALTESDGTGEAMPPTHPALALAFASVLVWYAVRDLGRLSRRGDRAVASDAACRIGMGVTMAITLVVMI